MPLLDSEAIEKVKSILGEHQGRYRNVTLLSQREFHTQLSLS